MFYGVEQSTDMRARRTVIKKFRSKAALEKWLAHGGGFTHGDPVAAKNHHHSHRSGYELRGKIDKRHNIFGDRGTPCYPRSDADNTAFYLYKFGEPV